jgi:hypothetical protein
MKTEEKFDFTLKSFNKKYGIMMDEMRPGNPDKPMPEWWYKYIYIATLAERVCSFVGNDISRSKAKELIAKIIYIEVEKTYTLSDVKSLIENALKVASEKAKMRDGFSGNMDTEYKGVIDKDSITGTNIDKIIADYDNKK